MADKLVSMRMSLGSVQTILECPVCYQSFENHIYMCINGHNVCSTCQPGLKACPVCRAPGAPISRNMALEDLSSKVLLPCPNKEAGCNIEVVRADLNDHLIVCDFGYHCAHFNCDWVGQRKFLFDHCELQHPGTVADNTYPPIMQLQKFDRFGETNSLGLFKLENELFWVYNRYNSNDSRFYFYAVYIGPDENAAKYIYRITIPSIKHMKRFTFGGITLTESEYYKRSEKTFYLDMDVMKSFIANDDTFCFTRFIYPRLR